MPFATSKKEGRFHGCERLQVVRSCCIRRERLCGLLAGRTEMFSNRRSSKMLCSFFAPSSVLVTTSKALVTRSDVLVTSSFLFLKKKHKTMSCTSC